MKNDDETSGKRPDAGPDSGIPWSRNPVILFLIALWVAAACLLVAVIFVGLVFNTDMSGILAYSVWGFMQLVLLTLVIYIAWRVKLWIEDRTGDHSSPGKDLLTLQVEVAEMRRIVGETRERVARIEKLLEDVAE